MSNARLFSDMLYPDLIAAKRLIYDPHSYICTQPIPEPESVEYNGCTFLLNALHVKFRSAKITPKKIGQFVTLWTRNEAGITQPHQASDVTDLFVISVRKDYLFGQFVFPKSALIKNGVVSTPEKEGKRGFRVYPPWDLAENKQAQKTQAWQLEFFLEIPDDTLLDVGRAKLLYHLD